MGAVGSASLAGCTTSILNRTETHVEPEHRPGSFVDADGTRLTIDGDPVYLFGTRPQYVNNFNETKPDVPAWLFGDIVTEMFDHLVRMGATVARVHGFQPSWGDRSAQPKPGEISERHMERFDRVIEAARNRGLRLVVMLINAAPMYDYSKDPDVDTYGVNVPTYVEATDDADELDNFYTSEECIDLYKQRVERVLTRENTLTGVEYRDDPTIAMWELGNEIEWEAGWERDSESLRPWIEEVGNFVKSLDDNHLLTTGEHGWPDGRNDFVDDHRPDCIDVCSIHYWPGPEHYDLANQDWADHPDILRERIETGHRILEKPVWVGEYNWAVEPGSEPPFPERVVELEIIHDVFDETDVAASAFHALGLDGHQTHTRGSTTVFADTDDETIAEFRRFAEQEHEKSADETIPPLSFQNSPNEPRTMSQYHNH